MYIPDHRAQQTSKPCRGRCVACETGGKEGTCRQTVCVCVRLCVCVCVCVCVCPCDAD